MPSRAISTWTFALALVKWGRHVLLIQEAGHQTVWSIPGGRVEEGESLVAGMRREVRAQTGLEVDAEGILRLEYTPIAAGDARLRMFFLARPSGDTVPKVAADQHSLGARWFTRGEVATLPLRSPEVHRLVSLAFEGPVAPLSLFGSELEG
jgi:phosphatase NudJ